MGGHNKFVAKLAKRGHSFDELRKNPDNKDSYTNYQTLK